MICCDRFFYILVVSYPRSAPTLPKPHYPLLRTTTLASLVKGEVLSPERIRATTGGIATPTFRSALTFPKPHYPSKIANTLASLVKGELLLLSFAQPTIEGLPHRTLSFPQPLQKDNNPSPCTTTLASLVKGRWIDGKAQTVALLLFTCDMSALFILQTFLPSRRRDCLSCIDPLHPHNHYKKTIIPRPTSVLL